MNKLFGQKIVIADNKYYFSSQKGLISSYDSGFIVNNGFRKLHFSSQLRSVGQGFFLEMNGFPTADSLRHLELDESILVNYHVQRSNVNFVKHVAAIKINESVVSILLQSNDTLFKRLLGDSIKELSLVLSLNNSYSNFVLKYDDPNGYYLDGDMEVTAGRRRLKVHRNNRIIRMKLSRNTSM